MNLRTTFIHAASIAALAVLGVTVPLAAQSTPSTNQFTSIPLSLNDAINIGLQRNSAILKAQADLENTYGLIVQTRSIAMPHVTSSSSYQRSQSTAVETIPFPGAPNPGTEQWAANIRLVQTIYEGGRIRSALRTSKIQQDQALLNYQTVASDVVLNIQVTYNDVLLAAEEIHVQEAALELVGREVMDAQRRYAAGTVPQFNVLRAEVEEANTHPRLIRARNAYRIANSTLANQLGLNDPAAPDIKLNLIGKLETPDFNLSVSTCIQQALENRSEIRASRKTEKLGRESIIQAKAGYLPRIDLFTGYGARNSSFSPDLGRDVSGWFAGAEMNWDIFDGWATRGKVRQSEAALQKSSAETLEIARNIELQVRTAHSSVTEAREVLDSQKKTIESAEEAVRLVTARVDAGTGTQLDLLSAQEALTAARTTQIEAVHDYGVALKRLERAIGAAKYEPVRK